MAASWRRNDLGNSLAKVDIEICTGRCTEGQTSPDINIGIGHRQCTRWISKSQDGSARRWTRCAARGTHD